MKHKKLNVENKESSREAWTPPGSWKAAEQGRRFIKNVAMVGGGEKTRANWGEG